VLKFSLLICISPSQVWPHSQCHCKHSNKIRKKIRRYIEKLICQIVFNFYVLKKIKYRIRSFIHISHLINHKFMTDLKTRILQKFNMFCIWLLMFRWGLKLKKKWEIQKKILLYNLCINEWYSKKIRRKIKHWGWERPNMVSVLVLFQCNSYFPLKFKMR
jgi:hypothetical protein